jgi:hypothetical protein
VGIRILTGNDRVRISKTITNELGNDYEVFEGQDLDLECLPSLFFGTTLFSNNTRKILIKDLGENKELFKEFATKVEEFAKTDSNVIIWESALDKRLALVKNMVKSGIKIDELKAEEKVDFNSVFNIFDIALRDGEKAVNELEKIESTQDPYMFFGLIVSQAIKKFELRATGRKEKKILKELSEIDMQMKTTAVEPWLLIKGFLLRLTSF